MAGSDSSHFSVVVALAVNSVITVAKSIGWFLTASPSMLAESIHSAADVGNQVLLWVGLKKSAREADPEHPYGYGPARYLWNLKSAMGIFFLGCGVTCYHGIEELFEFFRHGHHDYTPPPWIGLAILGAAFVLEGIALWVAWRGIQRDKGDMTLKEYFVQGDDPTSVGVLLEDSAAVLGVVLALIGVGLSTLLHTPLPDAIATLTIGILLGGLAVFLAKTNGDLLIGRAVPPEVAEAIRRDLEADEIVDRVEDLKTEILGQGRIRVKAEIELRERMVATRFQEKLAEAKELLDKGEEPMKVLVDLVGRAVRTTGHEVQRLDAKVRETAPNAVHVDLELL